MEGELLNRYTKEYFINFEQSPFWIQATGIKHGIIQNEKKLDVGKFSIKKAGVSKIQIMVTDLSDQLIINAIERSVLTDKWEIKDSKNNIIGIFDLKQGQWLLVDNNEKKLLKMNLIGLQGEISEWEGKIVAQLLLIEDVKVQGSKFTRKYSYHLKVIDQFVDRKLLLGFFFIRMIGYHRSGETM